MTRRLVGALLLLTLVMPAHAEYDETVFERKHLPSYTIRRPSPDAPPTETVIGRVQAYRIRKGDTLIDLARLHGLGWNEITEANPHVDPWIPPAGATILLPTEWVLPCCSYDGVIVNIPEMRLFFFQRVADDPGAIRVQTYAVGLGRDEWRTPQGKFKIRGKTENPTWVIPESIRKEHIEERGDHRRSIAGGDPDNPLGKHRLELTLPSYGIHGTNIPWGVGMQVSHGCVRLYPEDIRQLFPTVPVGTPGEFAYEPVKAGQRGGVVWVETHRDIYGYTPALYRKATEALERAGLTERVDRRLLIEALEDTSGLPVRVSPEIESEYLWPVGAPLGPHGLQESDADRVPHSDHDQARDG